MSSVARSCPSRLMWSASVVPSEVGKDGMLVWSVMSPLGLSTSCGRYGTVMHRLGVFAYWRKPEPGPDGGSIGVQCRRSQIVAGRGGRHPNRVAHGRDASGQHHWLQHEPVGQFDAATDVVDRPTRYAGIG